MLRCWRRQRCREQRRAAGYTPPRCVPLPWRCSCPAAHPRRRHRVRERWCRSARCSSAPPPGSRARVWLQRCRTLRCAPQGMRGTPARNRAGKAQVLPTHHPQTWIRRHGFPPQCLSTESGRWQLPGWRMPWARAAKVGSGPTAPVGRSVAGFVDPSAPAR